MILTDMNQTWKAPEGCIVQSLTAEGAFLRIVYVRTRLSANIPQSRLTEYVTIYLNDQGREVVRVEDFFSAPVADDEIHETAKPLSLRERIELWFRVNFRGE